MPAIKKFDKKDDKVNINPLPFIHKQSLHLQKLPLERISVFHCSHSSREDFQVKRFSRLIQYQSNQFHTICKKQLQTISSNSSNYEVSRFSTGLPCIRRLELRYLFQDVRKIRAKSYEFKRRI